MAADAKRLRRGTPFLEFLHVDDMAEASLFVLALARLVARVTGYGGRLVFDTSKPDGAPRKLMDSGRLEAMGWKARVSLRITLGYSAAQLI